MTDHIKRYHTPQLSSENWSIRATSFLAMFNLLRDSVNQ